MSHINVNRTVFHSKNFSPIRPLVADCAPTTPSTDYLTDSEDFSPEQNTKELKGSIDKKELEGPVIAESTSSVYRFDLDANIPEQKRSSFASCQLFGATNANKEDEFEALHHQISSLTLQLQLLQEILASKEAGKTSEKELVNALRGAKKEIGEKDKTIAYLEIMLQKEKLAKKTAIELTAAKQVALDDATEKNRISNLHMRNLSTDLKNEIQMRDKTIAHLEIMFQKEKLKKKSARELTAAKQVALDDATERICVTDIFMMKITSDLQDETQIRGEVEKMLDAEKEKVLRRDNLIVQLKSMLQEAIDQKQATHVHYNHNVQNHQSFQQKISNYSESTVQSSGGGVLINSGGGGPRCSDGSRDMRFKANKGFSKYG